MTDTNFCEGLNQPRTHGVHSKCARIPTSVIFTVISPAWPVQKSNVLGKIIVHFHELNELALAVAAAVLETIFYWEKHL